MFSLHTWSQNWTRKKNVALCKSSILHGSFEELGKIQTVKKLKSTYRVSKYIVTIVWIKIIKLEIHLVKQKRKFEKYNIGLKVYGRATFRRRHLLDIDKVIGCIFIQGPLKNWTEHFTQSHFLKLHSTGGHEPWPFFILKSSHQDHCSNVGSP